MWQHNLGALSAVWPRTEGVQRGGTVERAGEAVILSSLREGRKAQARAFFLDSDFNLILSLPLPSCVTLGS